MEEKQKVYIRGCKGRGSEVIDILTGLGAKETIDGNYDDRIYFINHHNKITCALIDSEVGAIIMDNYKEVELPPKPTWKDGDVLVDEWNRESYAVFKEYGKETFFRAYFVFLGKEIYFDELEDAGHYRLANAKEMRKAPMLFDFLLDNLDAVRRCFPKKAEIGEINKH